VVLDPGHGGQDTGVRGPGGSLEKDVALAFARLMVTRLKAAYRVVLTRTDDYAVKIPMRTAAANHEKADLFLSIHAAGSLNPESHGIGLFCFEPSLPPDTTQDSPPGGGGDAKKRSRRWDRLQLGHQSECEAFAGMLETTVRHATGRPVRIHHAPLSVLKGADMPALLVEIGYLTHSQEETRLQNPAEMAVLADSVCDAVFDYLK
jgi:N-acetylmuramoyl-L-alanine amidase